MNSSPPQTDADQYCAKMHSIAVCIHMHAVTAHSRMTANNIDHEVAL